MLQRRIIQQLSGCMLLMLFICLMSPIAQSAGTPTGTPGFGTLSFTSSDDNRYLTLTFTQKVYSKLDPKTGISQANLDISIIGGTATLSSYTVEPAQSKNKAAIVITTNGNPDGNELLVVKPVEANPIYNSSGIAMAADAQVSVALRDMSPPQFSDGYPNLQNITANSVDLKVKSNEAGTAYFVVAEEGNHAPAYLDVKFGFIWNGNGWGPVANNRKGSTMLQASEEASIAISELQAQSRYYIFVVLKDQLDNFSVVNRLELNTGSAGGSQATVSSSSYTVDDTVNTISGVVYGTTLADFTGNLTPVSGASVKVYQADGTTEASDIADGYKLIVTAADTTTTKIYTIQITVLPLSSAKEMISFSIVDPSVEGVISGNNILVVVPPGTAINNLKSAFTLSAQATAKVGDVVQQSGVTLNNFSSPVNYVINAEDGSSNTYTVNVADELTILKNAVLVGTHLFQLDNSNGMTRNNIISALGTGSNLWYKSSNGSWYDLLQINSINDLFDTGKAINPGAIVMTKWYKTGDTVQIIP